LAKSGCHVTVVSRSKNSLEECCKRFAEEGLFLEGISTDLSISKNTDKLFNKLKKDNFSPDIVVFSNGGPKEGEILSLSEEDILIFFQQHFLSLLAIIKFSLPSMKVKGWGRFINISSLSAKQPLENLDLSNFLRPGLAAIFKSLAKAQASSGITFNTICPGSIMTDRTRALLKVEPID
jgi:3-oxoacyl-[acyl-carrier protein] reductase